MLNVICERLGREFGPQYPDILRDMVTRNLPEGMAGRFICITDQADNLDVNIHIKDPATRPRDFAGERILFLPLNCCIVGPLDKIVSHPIFVHHHPTITELRELFPGQIVDYDGDYFPKGAKIVLFGDKKPDECGGWVTEVWKIGGGTVAELVFDSNVTQERIAKNIENAHKRPGSRWLQDVDAHDGVAIIAAGGPSLRRSVPTIALLQRSGAKLFAINRVAAFLNQCGIKPDAHVLLDGIPDVIEFVDKSVSMERYYASQCDPGVLDAAGDELTIWDPYIEGILEVVPNATGPFIGGGTTVGTRAIGLAYMLGYRKIHVFGLDSSCEGGDGHAYPQIGFEKLLDISFNGRAYKAPPQLLAQVEEFKNLIPEILANGVELIIHGDGLLPDVAAHMLRPAA